MRPDLKLILVQAWKYNNYNENSDSLHVSSINNYLTLRSVLFIHITLFIKIPEIVHCFFLFS